jgi:hypothetical protein
MTSLNSKLILSALGVALLATPSFAGPRDHSLSAQSNNVIVDGNVIGADPDLRIRSALAREWDSLHGE